MELAYHRRHKCHAHVQGITPLTSYSVLVPDASACEHFKQSVCSITPGLPQESKHITEILAEQLAEQHIPLILPFALLPRSTASEPHEPDQHKDHLPDVPAPCITPQSLLSCKKELRDSVEYQQLSEHTSATQTAARHTTTATDSDEVSSQQSQHDPLRNLNKLNAVQNRAIADWARSAVTACRTDPHTAACEAVETLSVTNSRGHTWLGLTLQQALLRHDLQSRDNEASVQVCL